MPSLDMSDVVCLVALVMYDKDAQVRATDIKNLSQGAQTVQIISNKITDGLQSIVRTGETGFN